MARTCIGLASCYGRGCCAADSALFWRFSYSFIQLSTVSAVPILWCPPMSRITLHVTCTPIETCLYWHLSSAPQCWLMEDQYGHYFISFLLCLLWSHNALLKNLSQREAEKPSRPVVPTLLWLSASFFPCIFYVRDLLKPSHTTNEPVLYSHKPHAEHINLQSKKFWVDLMLQRRKSSEKIMSYQVANNCIIHSEESNK